MNTPAETAGTSFARWRRELRQRLVVAVGLAIIGVLGRTWRYRIRDDEGWRRLRAGRRPFLFVLWHGGLLPLTFWHRDEGITVLVSEHSDGEIIARVIEAWGYRTIRGSTTRGASRALLGLIRELEEGRVLAVTPDGPRGPARKFQPGALVAAQRAGVPLVAITLGVDRAWSFGSWDRFLVPKPFARVTIAYSPPTTVDGASSRDAMKETGRFEAIMQKAEDRTRDA